MASLTSIHKIDELLQFALLTAGQEDDFMNRDLGPIHLIKYVYLADLTYAETHNGETYTGIPWIFHHYGPWSLEVYKRIEPALMAIGANKKTIESKYFEDDMIRWSLVDDELFDELYEKIHISIAGVIQKNVRRFGDDTKSLLNFVYNTHPMLKAAPGEPLDLTPLTTLDQDTPSDETTCKTLTYKEKKKRKQQLGDIKTRFRERLKKIKKTPREAPTPPRYDEVYWEAVRHIDSFAGEHIEPDEYTISVTDDVWKSKSRFDPELS